MKQFKSNKSLIVLLFSLITTMKILVLLTLFTTKNKFLFAQDIFEGENCQLFSASDRFSATSNFTELANKYGYQSEEYEVTTGDGYILGIFRIRGKRGLPILLMHGITDSSDTWLVRGHTSLGITLAAQDYDVWFGNVRGNKYSKRHVKLNPEKDASFWDFSFHEHGYHDLAAIIDAVLSHSGSEKLNAFAHSQGNTMFYVLGATRPEYNEKVNVMTALAPICFLSNVPPPLSTIVKIAPEINEILEKLDMNELLGNSPSGQIVKKICKIPTLGYTICTIGVLFPLLGFDMEEFAPSFYYAVLQHYPSTSTRKNLYHYAQIAHRGRFARYDNGAERNLIEYNDTIPPEYDLHKVTMPIVLLAGRNDKISVLADVDALRVRLPNVVNYTVVKRQLMNHLDYVWGENMKEYLFPYIFDILDEYNIKSSSFQPIASSLLSTGLLSNKVQLSLSPPRWGDAPDFTHL